MKTQTIMSKTKFVLLAFLVAFSFSCSPEDGNDGAPGAQGPQGPQGPAGTDGNANVQTFVFDTSEDSGNSITIAIPEITLEVMQNDVILSYYSPFPLSNNSGLYYSMPGAGQLGNFVTRVFTEFAGEFNIRFHNWDGTFYNTTPGEVKVVKIIIIESSSTTTGKVNSKQQIYNELNQAGVNIKDYYAVCDYYGIAY